MMLLLLPICISFVQCSDYLSNTNKSRIIRETGQLDLGRDAKFLNIFQLISFPNNECTVSEGENDVKGLGGTCLSTSGCDAAGGVVSGACAQGFGACCLLYHDSCGATVTRNRTYIRNPGYPSAYQDSGTCTWTLKKCQSNICQIRLDYQTFNIQQPASGTAPTAGSCSSKDRFYGNPVTGANLPTICGEAAGQHMYLDAGAYSSQEATLVATLTGSQSPKWRIKVSMIECGSASLPPPGCMQYHTGLTGTIRSFNFNAPSSAYNHLQSQNYRACIRQEEGYCKIGWQQSSDSFSFKLARSPTSFNSLSGTNAMACGTTIASNCDYVTIPNGSNGDAKSCQVKPAVTPPTTTIVQQVDHYGGGTLTCVTGSSVASEVVSDTFTLGVFFNAYEGTTTNRGFCLNYRQISC